MSKSLNQLFRKKSKQTRKLWDTEFNIVEQGLDEEQVISFINALTHQNDNPQDVPIKTLRALIDRAVADAETIATSIKKKAEEEAGGIIDRTSQEYIEEPKEESDEPKLADNPIAEESIIKIKEEQPIQPGEETEVENTIEKEQRETLDISKDDTAGSESVESIEEELPEPLLQEGILGNEKIISNPITIDKEALYTGEVALGITVPVNPVAVSKLYNYLQTVPDLKVLYTRGSWDRGTTITVSLDKPLPIIRLISNIPGVVLSPASTQEYNSSKVVSSSLLGANRKEATRIDITLSEG
ncbi:hypothetical protein ACFLWR_02840 [Chloroflexota bacterium]